MIMLEGKRFMINSNYVECIKQDIEFLINDAQVYFRNNNNSEDDLFTNFYRESNVYERISRIGCYMTIFIKDFKKIKKDFFDSPNISE